MATTERGRNAAYVYVFTASFCLMVIEIVAGRLISPYLGSSLYTWTSVIGVVLTGISVGNYAGGVAAERGAGWRAIGLIFVAAGAASALAPYAHAPIGAIVLALSVPPMIATLAFSLVMFFPIAFLLSMVTPIIVTRSLTSLKKTGTTVGSIYACSAAASILGTFATGFFLIAFLGVETIVLSVAAVLLLAGIAAARDAKVTKGKAVLLSLTLLWLSFLAPKLCVEETAYFCIKVDRVATPRGTAHRFVLDRLTHSYVYEDPRVLEYDYENVYAAATEYLYMRDGKTPDALFIGGGGYVMPKFVRANYDEGLLDVIEIDPGITAFVEREFGISEGGGIRSFNEDARTYLTYRSDGEEYDIIFGDAFTDYSVPYHLTTREFSQIVRDHLADDGIYAMNIIDDHDHGRVLASFVRTAMEVFPYVEVAPLSEDWRQPGRNTFVLLASPAPLDRERWTRAVAVAYDDRIAHPASRPREQTEFLLPHREVAAFVEERKGLVLTDDFSPIDNLAAPLFGGRRF